MLRLCAKPYPRHVYEYVRKLSALNILWALSICTNFFCVILLWRVLIFYEKTYVLSVFCVYLAKKLIIQFGILIDLFEKLQKYAVHLSTLLCINVG